MGHPVPEEPFIIDPAKNYLVTVDWWTFLPGLPRCGGVYEGKVARVRTGADIIFWIEFPGECSSFPLVRPPLTGAAERIFSIEEV